jgi:hypothetical protein
VLRVFGLGQRVGNTRPANTRESGPRRDRENRRLAGQPRTAATVTAYSQSGNPGSNPGSGALRSRSPERDSAYLCAAG